MSNIARQATWDHITQADNGHLLATLADYIGLFLVSDKDFLIGDGYYVALEQRIWEAEKRGLL